MSFQLMLAVVAGLFFSLIALSYRINAARGVPPAFAALVMGAAGILWFGMRSFAGADAPGWSAPAMVWIWGAVNGLAQAFVVHLYRVGLRHGPLAPLWCAGNLTFVTPALYAVLLLSESLSGMQMAGMAAAFLCVTVSSMGHGEEPGPAGVTARASFKQRFFYGGILLMLTLLTGLVGVALKHMTATFRQDMPLNPRYNDCFMLGMYFVMTLCLLDVIRKYGRPSLSWARLTLNGSIGGVGSVVGMVLTAKVSDLPGGVGFAVLSVSSVLGGALITSFGFHEKRGRAWYATLALAVLSVVLFNMAR